MDVPQTHLGASDARQERLAAPFPVLVSSENEARLRLVGRQFECDVLDQTLLAIRNGTSQTLVLHGEFGVGKTALLDYVAAKAADCQVIRVVGVESEMKLAFAGLQQLCAPLLGRHLDGLPSPQRDALATVFGLIAGPVPELFLVGLAVLSLLSEGAEQQPLLCIIDDAQWLDDVSGQTLTFVARRLMAERVGLLFASQRSSDDQLGGLPVLPVGELNYKDSRTLLNSKLHGPVDESVLDRVIAESHGNPLALLELPRAHSPAELAGGFGTDSALPMSDRLEASFARRLDTLPRKTRRLMLLAAIEPVGDRALLWRAADRLGIPRGAATPAELAGLVEAGAGVRFRHPLVRSAAQRSGRTDDLREMHRALAEETDALLDPDRRAWHLAQATWGPDEAVAAELERSADRAQSRGGLTAYAAFLQRAVELTPDAASRGLRALAAARAQYVAGVPNAALLMLDEYARGPGDSAHDALSSLLRALIASGTQAHSEALPLLLAAARELEDVDVALARETYLDALASALVLGRSSDTVTGVARNALAAPSSPQPPRPVDRLLDGFTIFITERPEIGHPALRSALDDLVHGDTAIQKTSRWEWLSDLAAITLWDDTAWDLVTSRHADLARKTGALGDLPYALNGRAFVHLFSGEIRTADSLSDEAQAIAEATHAPFAPIGAAAVAAFRGQEDETEGFTDAIIASLPSPEGIGASTAHWARSVLFNGLGRYADGVSAAEKAFGYPEGFGFATWSVAELVEAASRTGDVDRAAEAFAALRRTTQPASSDWGLGVEARSHALLCSGSEADALYRESVDRLERTRMKTEAARAHLLYGEWLRRENRRRDAREHLRIAHNQLAGMGAHAFAERARRELLATGESVRNRSENSRDTLTAQESQIAVMARDGRTNHEIGAELFISSRTVEWHLRKIYPKLGITSRRELPTVPFRR